MSVDDLRGAVSEALGVCGLELLGSAQRFVGAVSDVADPDSREVVVLRRCLSDDTLAPYRAGADRRDADALTEAAARLALVLTSDFAIDSGAARQAAAGIALGICDHLGIELPEGYGQEAPAQAATRAPQSPRATLPVQAPLPAGGSQRSGSGSASRQEGWQNAAGLSGAPSRRPQGGLQGSPSGAAGQQQWAGATQSRPPVSYGTTVSGSAAGRLNAPSYQVQRSQPNYGLIGLAAAVATLVVAFFVLNPFGSGTGSGALGGLTGGTGTGDATDGSVEGSVAGVPVRAELGEYSWDELAQIADAISASGSRSAGIQIASEYGLCTESGIMYESGKVIETSDGHTFSALLVDVYRDEGPQGTAGLTFMAAGTGYHQRMASGTTMPGGWRDSEMRSWLNSSVYGNLPSDLASLIVPVDKRSNNVGKSDSTSCVSATTDTLWLFSIVEVTGTLSWEFASDPANSGLYNAIFNAEGSQYAYFAQNGIDTEGGNAILQMGELWWFRSSAGSTGRGRYVDAEGNPSKFGDSNESHGVVFGFCL